jgi:hypothetical protein
MIEHIDRYKEARQKLDNQLRIAEFADTNNVRIDKVDAYFYMALLDELILRLVKENGGHD